MDLHTNEGALEAMAMGDPNEPVVMLNLLRYREIAEDGVGVDGLTGREAYEQYGRAFAELGPRFGGTPIWMGRGHHPLIGTEAWDIIILVRYPARKNFIDMVNDPDYRAIAPIRAAALADSRLLEMTQLLPKP